MSTPNSVPPERAVPPGEPLQPEAARGRSASLASGIGRAALVGGAIGFVVVTLAVWAVVAIAGGGSGSIGAGIVAGWFRGIGFGAMEGATAYANSHPEG